MIAVIQCGVNDHDPALVLIALVICAAGSRAVFSLLKRIDVSSGVGRLGWIALSSVALGAMTWTTHFVAMMGYRPGVPVLLDPMLTMVSLLIAIAAGSLALAVVVSPFRFGPSLGGGLVGLSVSALHYTGLAAYRIEGIASWDVRYIAASVLLSILLGAAAFAVYFHRAKERSPVAGSLLLSACVAALHFTGMAAISIVPLATADAIGLSQATLVGLAMATAFAGLLVTGCVAVSLVIDTHTQEESFRHLTKLALQDALTGLPNRAQFDQTLARMLTDEHGPGGLTLVMIDLSNFKHVNDSYGHQAGDQLLAALSERFKQAMSPDIGFMARLGGDEFAAILPCTGAKEVQARLSRISGVFEQPFRFQRFTCHAGANIGVATFPDHGDTLDQLLANADRAMYRAKTARSTIPCFYEPSMDQGVREKWELSNRLRAAIGTDAFEVHYQVQASLLSQEITGYEALCRWRGADGALISPAIFIPLAEENGEIVRLGAWVLRRACRDAVAWAKPHLVAVNLSPLQLRDASLVATVTQILRETGLAPSRLELELTESSIIDDRHDALSKLTALKSLGVRLALDDFGVGYSSLQVLRSLPFDRIKLDGSFMSNIVGHAQATAILSSVALLGRKLGMPILAEGVETPEQLAIAAREGCVEVQGYLLGRPGRTLADPDAIRRTMSPSAGPSSPPPAAKPTPPAPEIKRLLLAAS